MNKPNRQSIMAIQTATKDYMTAQDLAAWLGISLRPVANLRRRRALPHLKIGRLVRFSREQVESALRSYTIDGLPIRFKE
jgi:excisionase family DNA binding protein